MTGTAEVRLEHNTAGEVEAYLETDDRILLPVGSVEQHGDHLPLGTDSFVARELALSAAEELDVLVASQLWYGWSPHHMARGGTVSVDSDVLGDLAFEVVESLSEHGFRNVVFVNGHRVVNVPWLQIAAERCQRDLNVTVEIFDPAYMQKEVVDDLDVGTIGHGDPLETSHLMYLMPEAVDLDEAVDYEPDEGDHHHVDPSDDRDTLAYVPGTVEEMRDLVEKSGGTKGNPSESSEDVGRRLQEHLVDRLVTVIEGIASED
jgi:creatinine amidohydrolase